MDVLTTINGYYPSLTKAEQKIAQYVLVNSEDVQHLAIGELATKAEVAETTVIRFCRKLDFNGYQEFKLQLARDLAANQVRSEGDNVESDPLIAGYQNYLGKYSKSVDPLVLKDVAKQIDQAHAVCLFGAGLSAIVGNYLKSRLMRMGISVIYEADVHLQAIDIAVLQPEDLVIVISTSGNTIDVLQNVKIAQRFGVKVIAISNYLSSKLSALSDVTIVPPAGSGADSSELLPVMGQLVTIDLICKQLQLINPERTRTLKERINETLMHRIE